MLILFAFRCWVTRLMAFSPPPTSPWQRGPNENTNGLLRRHQPKGSSMAGPDQHDSDLVAAGFNDRPWKRLDFATPNKACNSLLATLAGGGEIQKAVVLATDVEFVQPKR